MAIKVHVNLNFIQDFMEHDSKNIFKVFLNSPLFFKLLLMVCNYLIGEIIISDFLKNTEAGNGKKNCLFPFSPYLLLSLHPSSLFLF